MNPVLGSTQEFDKYINDRLNPPPRPASRGATRPTSSQGISKGGQLGNNNHGNRSDYAKIIGNNSLKEDAVLNVRPISASRSRPTASTRISSESKLSSQHDELPQEFVHSWKRHLNVSERSPSPLQTQIKIPIPMVQKNIPKYDDDDLEPRVYSVKKEKSPQKNISSPSRFTKPFEFPEFEPGEFRRRIKTLERIFKAWVHEIKSMKQRFFKFSLRIEHRHEYFLQRMILRDWFNMTLSNHHLTTRMERNKKIYFTIWEEKALRRRIHRLKLLKYKKYAFGMVFIQRLKDLVMIRKVLLQKKRRESKALNYRSKRLKKWIFVSWKRYWKKISDEKKLLREQQERKSKIQGFIDRMKNPESNAKEREESKSDQRSVHSGTSSKGRDVSAGRTRRPVSSTNAPPVSNRLFSRKSETAKEPVRAKDSMKSPRSQSSQSNTPHSGRESKQQEEREFHSKMNNDDDEAEEFYLDDFEEIPANEAPPSYRQFLDPFGNPVEGDQAVPEGFVAKKNLKVIPADTPPQVEKTEKREKLSTIRQQTFERVKQRQMQEEIKRKEKEMQEYQMEMKLKEELKMKKLEEKAHSMKALMLQAELKKKIAIAQEFRRKQLLIRSGFSPWIRFLEYWRLQNDKAIAKYNQTILKRIWQYFKEYYIAMKTERVRADYRMNLKASIFFKKHLQKRIFSQWKSYSKALYAREQAVRRLIFRGKSLKRKYLITWKLTYERFLRGEVKKLKSVDRRGKLLTMKFYLKRWKEFLVEQRQENELNFRVEQRWNMVQSWLRK